MLRRTEGRILIAAWAILAFIMLVHAPAKDGLTGFVISQGDETSHAFSMQDLISNSSSANISGNELKLNHLTEEKNYDTMETDMINISSARYNNQDEKIKIKNTDGEYIYADKNKAFDIILENNLTDGDRIQFYILDSDMTEIYLCNISQACGSPGYGSMNYDGNSGYYNITISGLSGLENGKNSFNIDPSVKVKFDSIRALKEYNLTHYYNISYYPMLALAETEDFMPGPDPVYSWKSLVVSGELNDQVVEYYYSTDSGLTWHYIENNNIGDADVSSGKIRLRILMTSNGIYTPVLRNITLTYSEKIVCNPGWEGTDNPCNADDSRLITYSDSNNCNATENLPADNGTYSYCDYCTPIWQETNTSCQQDDIITQYFTDANGCYQQTDLQSDNNAPGNNTLICDYCVPSITEYNTSCDGQTGQTMTTYYIDGNNCYSITGLVLDSVPANITSICINDITNATNTTQSAENSADQEEAHGRFMVSIADAENMILINAETTVNFTIDNVSVEEDEPYDGTSLIPLRGISIDVNDSVKSNISIFSLRVYYNDTVLNQSDINESTLAIYYYDEYDDFIQEIPSMINESGNYVQANITHFSSYGVYGIKNIDLASNTSDMDGQSGGDTGSGGNSQSSTASDESAGTLPAVENEVIAAEGGANIVEDQKEGAVEGLDEVSLESSYSYESSDSGANSTLLKVGRMIIGNSRKGYNLSTAAIFILMLVAVYFIAEMKAKKGYIK